MPRKIHVLGIDGAGRLGVEREALNDLLTRCEGVVGSSRQVALLASQAQGAIPAAILNWTAGIDQLVLDIEHVDGDCMVLASGDPGYFGVVRLLRSRLPDFDLEIHPVPSSISLAFARAGTNWEDATVISAHGRSYPDVLREILRALDISEPINKLAVLCSPKHAPQFIAQILRDARAPFDRYLVCSGLGSKNESVIEAPLDTICEESFDHHSVLLALKDKTNAEASISNLPGTGRQSDFAHRKGLITKPEIRELILSKLVPHLTEDGCLWDLGAGSGSVGISALQRRPTLSVYLVDSDPIQNRICEINSAKMPNATVVRSRIEDAIFDLPDPDAVFLGGGGMPAIESLAMRFSRPTFLVASFASINRAADAADKVGNLMQVLLPVGKRLPDGTWRLESENPVFIVWGLLG